MSIDPVKNEIGGRETVTAIAGNEQAAFAAPGAAPLVGATWDEVSRGIDRNPASVSPRFKELVDEGLIRDSGFRRKSQWGTEQIVWVSTRHAMGNQETFEFVGGRGHAKARETDPPTSMRAWLQHQEQLGKLKRQVLDYIDGRTPENWMHILCPF
jgi:hypothetical protein